MADCNSICSNDFFVEYQTDEHEIGDDIYLKMALNMRPDKSQMTFSFDLFCEFAATDLFETTCKVTIDSVEESAIFEQFEKASCKFYDSVNLFAEVSTYSNLKNIIDNKISSCDGETIQTFNLDDKIKSLIHVLLEMIPDDSLVKSAAKLS